MTSLEIGPFERVKPEIQTAARRAGDETADGVPALAVVEEIETAEGKQRQPIADEPVEIVIEHAGHLVEVLLRLGEHFHVGVERDPIDNVLLAGHAALRLPALIERRGGRRSDRRQFPSGR